MASGSALVNFQDWKLQPAKYGDMDAKFCPGEFLVPTSNLFNNLTEMNARGYSRYYAFVPDEAKNLKMYFDDENGLDFLGYLENTFSESRLEFPVDQVFHLTTKDCFDSIERDRMLKSSSQKIFHPDLITCLGEDGKLPRVWFTADLRQHQTPYRNWVQQRQDTVSRYLYGKHKIERFHPSTFRPELHAVTVPFGNIPRGGPIRDHGFSFNLKELLVNYCQMVDSNGFVARCFGTEAYKTEVMYAVMIHPTEEKLNEKEKNFFCQFPLLVNRTNSYFYNKNFNWDWDDRNFSADWVLKPFSTSTYFGKVYWQGEYQPKYSRWDHAAFALYVPGGILGFDLNELDYERFRLEY